MRCRRGCPLTSPCPCPCPPANVPGLWAWWALCACLCASPCDPGPGQRPQLRPPRDAAYGGHGGFSARAAFCQRSLGMAAPPGHFCGAGGAFSLSERRPESQRAALAPRRPQSRSCPRPSESLQRSLPVLCPSVPWRLQDRRAGLHLRAPVGSDTPRGTQRAEGVRGAGAAAGRARPRG